MDERDKGGIRLEWPEEEDFHNDKTGELLINPLARAEYKVWTSDPAWGMIGWKEDRFKWGLGRFMKNQGLEICVARAPYEIAGFSIGYEVSRERLQELTYNTPLNYETLFSAQQSVFWISDVGVIPEYRGRGVGKLLVGSVVQRVRETHTETSLVVLRTREQDAAALALYRSLSFVQIEGIHDRRYKDRVYFSIRLER